MIRYKMLGRDVNSSPTQYRTWVVNNAPDFDGYYYTGLKSGSDPLTDISAYFIADGYAVADFNLPDPLNWKISYKTLPQGIYHSSLAVINGYVYLFGGCLTNKIFRAPLNNPTDWIDTGATLPVALYGSQLAIIGSTIYLFGGSTGGAGNTINHIYTASTSNPLSWTDRGALLPKSLAFSQLAIINNNIYLFGGKSGDIATKSILSASTSTPLSWSDTGGSIILASYSSQIAIVNNNVYMYGGLLSPGNPTDLVFSCNINNVTSWSTVGQLPYKSYNAQIAVIANSVYLYGPTAENNPQASVTRILSSNGNAAHLSDSSKTIPGEVSASQLAIIYDRLFLFGGNGSSVVFANDDILKYKITDATAVTYGEVTRTEVNNAPSELDLFVILGMPPWKTQVGST